MAASAVAELMGGTPKQCLYAAAGAMANILGLVCDPIGGLVEAPCQQRNAMGVSNALISAEIALSGIENVVPFDEVVAIMYHVGRSMPRELRETALGGMASAPSACSRCRK
jgi:L-serine dehydratase